MTCAEIFATQLDMVRHIVNLDGKLFYVLVRITLTHTILRSAGSYTLTTTRTRIRMNASDHKTFD